MAKETMIVFVYDTQMLQKEEDDPVSAILYFHPTWVSDQQKAALCGQIIGTIQCVKSIFTKPKIVSLQSGKFFIIENGRYLLAVGTDRSITDWLLKYRAMTLYSIIKFFHKDFESLANIYRDESLSAKLYHMFETYLKVIVFGGNIFSHVPSLALPKSASNVFIEAIHILQCCQEFSNVLGGSILYHNKVVATQLSAHITKRLVLTDPYRIKCPAELAEVTFDLPLGVQLLQVYITNKEYCNLLESSLKNRNIYQYLSNRAVKKNYIKNTQTVQDTPIMSAMKRDQSLIFTAVPEEGADHSLPSTEPPFIPATKKIRPKFLNLKSISTESHVEVKQVKPVPGTPFCGQTSVCSTPMTELKKFVHQNPLSICLNNDVDSNRKLDEAVDESKQAEKFAPNDNYDAVLNKFVPYVNVTSNLYNSRKHSSLVNINEVVNSISKDKSQYFSVRSNGFVNLDLSPKKDRKLKTCKTITDPTFPVFRQDGTIVSHPYYEDFIKRNLEIVQSEVSKGKETRNNHINVKNNLKLETEPLKSNVNRVEIISKNMEFDISHKLPKVPTSSKDHRKSLTLPLKSLSIDSAQTPTETLVSRRYSSGVQLTPLISKLSMLAFEERSSAETPPPATTGGLTPTQQNYSFPYGKFKTTRELRHTRGEDDTTLQKCVLFICGQQDVVLAMLLKEECGTEPNTVKKLWEVCTEHLGKLEKQLNYCMESQSGANPHESEPYSYLCLDPDWDTIKRGGPWGTNDLGTLNHLHRDFSDTSNLVEILIRGLDTVIYGYHCGPSEVFYHESANTNSGLPPPADPMGLVQLKAKRRLERDHAVGT
ncbi:hypothetical protein NQ318_017933 [Aromia moschata]|uniref:Hermansky-Pudlak syndrome 4 protein n=1 Tax=Aromia moschata TaxID=1265417 RepID=A0AAV8YD06_9CUCU|nr:hypothetical protein NQ318_017933 [Aromia moschata]